MYRALVTLLKARHRVGLLQRVYTRYDQQAPENFRFLLQSVVSFIGLFCKSDLLFKEPTNHSHPIGLLLTVCTTLLTAFTAPQTSFTAVCTAVYALQTQCNVLILYRALFYRAQGSCANAYGVATISRLLIIIGLFCRIQSLVQGSFAKETYNFKEPTKRSSQGAFLALFAGHLTVYMGLI